ncbi:MAG: peptidoglycan DD-metalloendopeptidase family protein [Marinifilaceae bacterium]
MKKFLKPRYLILGGMVLLGLILIQEYDKNHKTTEEEIPELSVDTTEAKQVHLKYGFPIDDFNEITAKVKKRQNLSTILQQYDVSYSTIDKVARKAKDVFNVRRIKPGHEYSMLVSKDSLATPEYFIYENTPVEYIVFDLRDTLNVYKGEKEVEVVRKSISGRIESSLWNAMVENGADPLLSVELSDIYAWTIDFFGISKGDQFNVIYEEEFVDGKSLRKHHVIACNLIHHNSENYAFAFKEGEKSGYFDEEGKSLQKAFLKAPLRYSRISSGFSNRRFHPVLKRYRAHHGVDYAAPTGTPVHSIGDGVVTRKGYQKNGGGRYVTIKHNSVYSTTYMHFSRFSKGIKPGVRIKQGQTIGYVGQSGLATGPHLDFRVYKNGKPINPLNMKSPPVAPVQKENQVAFQQIKDSLFIELNQKKQLAEKIK